MEIVRWSPFVWLLSGFMAGCRCSPLLNPYANAVDDLSDKHVYFDNWYHPRFDISRAGKPDWCGTNGRRHGWYGCGEGAWGRFDECHLYPPRYPYEFPSQRFINSADAEPQKESSKPPTLEPAPRDG
jgi:hypothetical protein